MADLAKIVDDLSSLTVLEAAELAKMLEEKWGVSAAAAVAVAAGPAARRRRSRRRGEDRVHRRPGRGRRQEDRGHQGGPRHHGSRPEGGQGPGRGRAEAGQGRRLQGGRREDQGDPREGRREGGVEVTLGHCIRMPDVILGLDPRISVPDEALFSDRDGRVRPDHDEENSDGPRP